MRRKDREITDIGEIERIIEKCKVCHVAMTDKGRPYLVPLNFGYEIKEGVLTLYFHSAKEGRKLDILRDNNAVCFEMMNEGKLDKVENPCRAGYFFESVLGFGQVEFIESDDEKCAALTLLMKQQTGQNFEFTSAQADSVCVFKLVSEEFTGKRKPEPNVGKAT